MRCQPERISADLRRPSCTGYASCHPRRRRGSGSSPVSPTFGKARYGGSFAFSDLASVESPRRMAVLEPPPCGPQPGVSVGRPGGDLQEEHRQARDITSTDPEYLVRRLQLGEEVAEAIDIIVGGPPVSPSLGWGGRSSAKSASTPRPSSTTLARRCTCTTWRT